MHHPAQLSTTKSLLIFQLIHLDQDARGVGFPNISYSLERFNHTFPQSLFKTHLIRASFGPKAPFSQIKPNTGSLPKTPFKSKFKPLKIQNKIITQTNNTFSNNCLTNNHQKNNSVFNNSVKNNSLFFELGQIQPMSFLADAVNVGNVYRHPMPMEN